jgi:hypothetical protein
MDEIMDQNQPVSHPVSLTCVSCIWAGQREAALQPIRARARLVTHRVSGPASSRNPLGSGPRESAAALFRPMPDLGARPAQQAC